jgi:hypothetical protein
VPIDTKIRDCSDAMGTTRNCLPRIARPDLRFIQFTGFDRLFTHLTFCRPPCNVSTAHQELVSLLFSVSTLASARKQVVAGEQIGPAIVACCL